jgi:hypothetical protein
MNIYIEPSFSIISNDTKYEHLKLSKVKDGYGRYIYYFMSSGYFRCFSNENSLTLANYICNFLEKRKVTCSDAIITLKNNYNLPDETFDQNCIEQTVFKIQKHIEYLFIMI